MFAFALLKKATFGVMNRTSKLLVGMAALVAVFAACNNEPPECSADQLPPLCCELVQKSGKKIDTLIVYHLGLDSVLCKSAGMRNRVNVPLSITGDTTFVQFTIIGETQTVVERYSSVVGITATPEMRIENLDCGPVYYFLDLDYTFYSVLNYSAVYSIDTVYETYNDSVYTYIDKRKVSVDTLNYIMSIDSIQYLTPDIGQNNETHARIFF